jgi:hypothetical protein
MRPGLAWRVAQTDAGKQLFVMLHNAVLDVAAVVTIAAMVPGPSAC